MDQRFSLRTFLTTVSIFCAIDAQHKQDVLTHNGLVSIIRERTGHDINIVKLLQQYSLVCPLVNKCVNVFSLPGKKWIRGCPKCNCNSKCIHRGNCCPDTIYGYLSYECLDMNIYPSKVSINYQMMIAHCPANGTYGDTTTRTKCTEENGIEPVTSIYTALSYKNQYCAVCHNDNDTIIWNLTVKCPRHINNTFEDSISVIDLMKKLKQNKCYVYYQQPGGPNNDGNANECAPEINQKKGNIIERCNVTGFWQDYDSDIEWACSELKLQYGLFKNVFCYICNPSIVSTLSTSIIDKCNVTGEWHESKYDRKLLKACKLQPHLKRLTPFKNIYCMLCNGIDGSSNSYYLRDQLEVIETHIHSRVSIKDNTVSTYVELSSTFLGKNAIKNWKTFVNKFKLKDTSLWLNNYETTKPSRPNKISLRKEMNAYTAVCGENQCKKFKFKNTKKIITNPVCQKLPCSCNPACVAKSSCCTEFVLSRRPYTCIKSNAFASVKPKSHATQQTNFSKIIDSKLDNSSFMVIEKCLLHNVLSNVSVKCSNNSRIRSYILENIPVQIGSVAYKNIYCLECSSKNITEENNITFSFQVECGNYLETALMWSIKSLLDISINAACVFSFIPKRSNKCEIKYDEYIKEKEIYVRGTIAFNKYENMYSSITDPIYNGTKKNAYSSCNITGLWRYNNAAISNICEGNPIALPTYDLNGQRYRNFACFLCNPEVDETTFDMDYMVSQCNVTGMWKTDKKEDMVLYENKCNSTDFQPRWLPFKNLYCSECNLPEIELYLTPSEGKYGYSYRTLFSLSQSIVKIMKDIDVSTEIPKCFNGTYDEVMKTCRDLFCHEGKFLSNGSCSYLVNEGIKKYQLSVELTPYLFGHEQANNNLTRNNNYIYLTVCLKDFQHGLLIDYKVCNNLKSNIRSWLYKDAWISIDKCSVETDSDCSQNCPSAIFYNKTSIIRSYLTINLKSTNLNHDEHALVKALSSNYTLQDERYGNVLFTASAVQAMTKPDQNTTNHSREYVDIDNSFEPLLLNAHTVEIQALGNMLTCTQLEFEENDYIFLSENKSITVNNHSIIFTQNEFEFRGPNVRICRDLYINKTYIPSTNTLRQSNTINKFAYVYNVFCRVCTFLSMFCLFLTFLTYCMFKSLRTIPGVNNICLVFSLFFAQGFLKFGLRATYDYTMCKVIGLLIHFFWLSTFCAMNACCIHMFKLFYASSMYSPNSNLSTLNRQIKYIIYIYGVPGIIVILTVCVHLLLTEGTSVGYGQITCFLSDIYTVAILFIAPTSLICIANIVLFSLAFHKIRTSPRMQRSSERHEFVICIKMCALVGITWPLQIVDAMLELTVFSYFVVGINASQGVFIFLSYVCNKRVLSLYKDKLCRTKQKKGTDISSNKTNSTPMSDMHQRISVTK